MPPKPISRMTKALINEATLEMDVRLEHAERQLTNFLEEELSTAGLGLGDGARAHLDRFRSFLHTFYVAKFGYWPPEDQNNGKPQSSFSMTTFRSMYFDFRSLYEYLVDGQSTNSMESNTLAEGGLCVLQNVMAFDRRNGYTSLEHPRPLLPDVMIPAQRRKSFAARALGGSFSKAARMEKKMAMVEALSAASNSENPTTMKCPLVREYIDFERACALKPEERVSATNARKVRWILVYCVLQTLISATRIPNEVRNTDGVSYNLCCRIPGIPPRTVPGRLKTTTTTLPTLKTLMSGMHGGVDGSAATAYSSPASALPSAESSRSASSLTSSPSSSSSSSSRKTTRLEIRPDTEQAMTRQKNQHRMMMMLSSSSDPNLAVEHPRFCRRSPTFCEILVYGYGNGLNAAQVDVNAHVDADMHTGAHSNDDANRRTFLSSPSLNSTCHSTYRSHISFESSHSTSSSTESTTTSASASTLALALSDDIDRREAGGVEEEEGDNHSSRTSTATATYQPVGEDEQAAAGKEEGRRGGGEGGGPLFHRDTFDQFTFGVRHETETQKREEEGEDEEKKERGITL